MNMLPTLKTISTFPSSIKKMMSADFTGNPRTKHSVRGWSAELLRVASVLVLLSCLSGRAFAQRNAMAPVFPQSLHWVSPPNLPALKSAWVLGAEQQPGPYLLRVKLAANGHIAPHTHPDERNSTVLSGTLYVGFGETFDEHKVVAVPTGAVYVTPAHVLHYVWAKDGDAEYQEAGVGPTGTAFSK